MVPAKKKVTFEALSSDDENEKENKGPKTKSKGRISKVSTTTAKKTVPAATGMRAKPIRKPVSTRATKTTRGASTKTATVPADEMKVGATEKEMSRALTPKKITQVAKATPLDSDGEEEDELAGAKTPVRDLNASPKRGLTTSPTRLLSPVKKLDFEQPLQPMFPEKPTAFAASGISSPPRRMPASPFRESLDQTPRRAPEGVTIFRTQSQDPHNGGSLGLNSPNKQSVLQQSPKRGITDSIKFPPSAMKSRASPLKNSLLASPARRLFSASKQRTPARFSPTKSFEQENATPPMEAEEEQSSEHEEVAVSSYFRNSVSPQRSARVYTLSEDELAQEMGTEVNFDDSVLDVRSPLKVDKVKPIVPETIMELEADEPITEGIVEPVVEREDKEAQQETSTTSVHDEEYSDVDNDETVMDPAVEAEEDSDKEVQRGVQMHDLSANEPVPAEAESKHSPKKPRMSDALFNRLRQMEDESEDELAADQTPDSRMLRPSFRPSMSAARFNSHPTRAVVPQSASRNLGFTPLAAQVQGWRAASPEKRTPATSRSQGLFSPIARMHVEGSVEMSRPNTPGSKRKSLVARASLAPSMAESLAVPGFFADGMAAQDFEELQVEGGEACTALQQYDNMHDPVAQEDVEVIATVADEDEGESAAEAAVDQPIPDNAELTTDLVNFTNASDTALVDFKTLANEAEQLAANEEVAKQVSAVRLEPDEVTFPPVVASDNEEESILSNVSGTAEDFDRAATAELELAEQEQSLLSTSCGSHSIENEASPIDTASHEPASLEAEALTPACTLNHGNLKTDLIEEACERADCSEEGGVVSQTGCDKPTVETSAVTDSTTSIECTPPKHENTKNIVHNTVEGMSFDVTPVRPDQVFPRVVHTVSKVPLRPEGDMHSTESPLQIQRKRARSLSVSGDRAVKRHSLAHESAASVRNNDLLATPKAYGQSAISPQRRIRSAAPSPAHSLASGLFTPGQMSFDIDDFGDSTLDGIEVPIDDLMSDELEETGLADRDQSMFTIGSTLFKAPAASPKGSSPAPFSLESSGTTTPHYAMSTKSSTRRISATPGLTPSRSAASALNTPTTATKAKTPSRALKSKLAAKTPQSARTPLKSVGSGILYGAVVHTDIHTSEGMDASAFYIDILTSMGARVVKDWRWNPRASIVPSSSSKEDQSEAQGPSVNPGITHVVYKDGGKRTLERVRSANGQVLCVGVGWVLDCMREGNWLDESVYAVDQTIVPRGGSRRRKSMEPRMLVNENGLLSASRDRRSRSISVGVELSGMSEKMKLELINTPVRSTDSLDGAISHDAAAEVDEETEISSTYHSPTAATVGWGGETADIGTLMAEQDALRTPGSAVSRDYRNIDVSTPQSASLAVDYDPRTAATPLTPYLVAKGRDLIQMSAPPKQVNKGIFDRDEDDSVLGEMEKRSGNGNGNGNGAQGKKFPVKGGRKVLDSRRKTLGVPGLGMAFKPIVGSPLRKE